MKIHEHQAKALFARYGIPVPKGEVATTPEEAVQAVRNLGGRAVLKAQVHAGGRGKGGGIKVVQSKEEASEFAAGLLGKNLVTPQTDAQGVPVSHLLVEELAGISRELYLAVTVDRGRCLPVMLVSKSGGMNIEEVATTDPDAIHAEPIDPVLGFLPYQARRLADKLDLNDGAAAMAGQIMSGLYRLFVQQDCSLVEINPLAVTAEGELIALDAKVDLEDDALFRHPDNQELADHTQENELEAKAAALAIAYVKLDGNVGCLVNGAGLAMATMDVISTVGAAPANFLDVGGGASEEKVAAAVTIILSDPDVDRVLVNIFGGILRCDIAAQGIIQAYKNTGSSLPLAVRMLGTNVEPGKKILRESGLDVTFANTMIEAAHAISQVR
ncbi:MAG: succinate--CoA ligase subunit beta [SAR202 cluster bacterium Io17-Chloro-G2]|nr:MAG: succinate--CoA ligase subunit beta [SAR202 cluster bacterium Io17-Chloro-G2]